MIESIKVSDRGPVPRKLKKHYNAAAKKTWEAVAFHFHAHYREKRFTPEHAREAGYTKRKGQGLPRDSKKFRRSYYGRKLRSKAGGGVGQADPLVFSGDAKRDSRLVKIQSFSSKVRLRYPGLRKLNRRHPKSQVRMSEEFRRITPREGDELGRFFDERFEIIYATPGGQSE